jgi:hypothetical protein
MDLLGAAAMTLQTIRLPRRSNGFPAYRYRGARAMVLLHEMNLREFVGTWKLAKFVGVTLPPAEDHDHSSLDGLVGHVFCRARNCLLWTCDQLEVPRPEIDEPPLPPISESVAQDYLDDLCRQWQQPLQDITEERFRTARVSNPWRGVTSIQMLLEHAVVHCQRHRLDLSETLVAACH